MTRIQWKKMGILCLVACLCFGMFASCKSKKGSGKGDAEGDGLATYTVQVLTEGGMAIKGIEVYVYEDETLGEMVTFAKTDNDGKIEFKAPTSQKYTAVLQNVPQGYALEEKYILKELETQIVLKAELVEVDNLEDVSFALGDVMSELTVTTYDGKTYVLSELLKEKKMVVLNFWYLGCTPCKMEFPHLQKAYEKYSDQVEILALNPVDGDDQSLKEYAQELGLTFPVATCDAGWQKAMKLVAYPTSVVIDRYGVISFIHQAYFEDVESIEAVFEHFTAEEYQQELIRKLDDLLTEDGKDEEKIENPTEVGGVTSFQLTVRAGETVYCDVYRVDGMYMQIKSKNVILEYQKEKYKPTNGVIGMVVHCKDTRTPMTIGLTNTGEETETYTINFSALAGTLNNPYTMELGEFDVSISAGSDQGVYYRYYAQEDGMLTVRCLSATAGVPYGYTLYNLNSYANRNLESDGTRDQDGNLVVQVKVKKGQVVQFNPSALADDNGSYPAIQMKFSAYMDTNANVQEEEVVKKIYAITVTDEKRTPLKDVQVIFTNAKGETESDLSNDKGVAALELPEGDYKAVVRLPSGYRGTTTSFNLTAKQPTVSIKLEKIPEIIYKEYIVTTVDKDGNPLEGVTVSVGQSYGISDASGVVKLTLPEGDYTALIGAPDGYTTSQISYPFGENSAITVTLEKDDGSGNVPNENQALYTVKVTDYSGRAMDFVTVSFHKDEQVVNVKTVNANGVASIVLDKGTYTVSLSFASGEYVYDTSAVTLTEAAPTITVVAVQKLVGETINTGNPDYPTGQTIGMGATALENMQPDLINMFIFDPPQAGDYRIEISDPNATVYFMGASSHFLFKGESSKQDGYITKPVGEKSLQDTLLYLGVEGTDSCVINITRTDIIETEEEKAEYIIYAGTVEPSKSNMRMGEMTYVDLTAKTSDIVLVLGSDGFYHLGSATGKIVYVNLGPTGRFQINFWNMLGKEISGGTNIHASFYNPDGTFDRKEAYNEWLLKYADCLNADGSGYYPLTPDLAYILQNVTRQQGWADADRIWDYKFESIAGFNPELGWMANCGTLD